MRWSGMGTTKLSNHHFRCNKRGRGLSSLQDSRHCMHPRTSTAFHRSVRKYWCHRHCICRNLSCNQCKCTCFEVGRSSQLAQLESLSSHTGVDTPHSKSYPGSTFEVSQCCKSGKCLVRLRTCRRGPNNVCTRQQPKLSQPFHHSLWCQHNQ